MSAGISIREFARRDGCDDKVVRRAISAGYLKTLADGSLDEALVGTGWRKKNRRADTAADRRADSADMSAPGARVELEDQPHGGALKRRRAADPDDDDLDVVDDDFIARVLAGETLNIAGADRVKANALALKQLLSARQAAGSLVEIELAERVLFEAARQQRDAWLNWPARIGPLIAADLDLATDRVVEILTIHVHAQLEELGEPDPDFSS